MSQYPELWIPSKRFPVSDFKVAQVGLYEGTWSCYWPSALFMNKVATHKKSINIFPVLLITNVRAENDLLPGKGRLEDMTILKELV